MPEAHAYAFAVTVSGRQDLTELVQGELVRFCEKAPYFAIVFEKDENERLHAHFGVIYNHGKKSCNVKACLLYPLIMRDFLSQNNSAHCCQVKRMTNEHFMTTYMAKSAPLHAALLPDDLEEIKWAFPELKAKEPKDMNPEFTRWSRMYHDDDRPTPAGEEDCYEFFHHHMYILSDLRIMQDQKRLKDRCLSLVEFINKDYGYKPYLGLQHAEADKPNQWKDKFLLLANNLHS